MSEAFYNKKPYSDLNIDSLSHYSCAANGGAKVILLCSYVKKGIEVIFFDNQGWEDRKSFHRDSIHHSFAIKLEVPPYKTIDIDKPVEVSEKILLLV